MSDPFIRIEDDGQFTETVNRGSILFGTPKDAYYNLEALANSDSEISVKAEIRGLMARHGRDGYLRKRTEQRCRCIDLITNEADPECPTCSALGYVYLDHKIRLFRHNITRQTSAAYRKDPAPFGVLSVDESVFYVATEDIDPSIHDWLVEVVTDTKGAVKRPPLIERCHDVNEIYDLRENYGQVAFWAIRARLVALGK